MSFQKPGSILMSCWVRMAFMSAAASFASSACSYGVFSPVCSRASGREPAWYCRARGLQSVSKAHRSGI